MTKEPKPAFCGSCGAEIVWLVTVGGKRMPCDLPLLTVVTPDGYTTRGYQSHFASCPQAHAHRKTPKNKGGSG